LTTINCDVPTSCTVSIPASAPSTEAVQETAPISQPTVDKPKWSIVYNRQIKRTLDITFEHALKHGFQPPALQFSRDGKFLAVAFGNEDDTRIYDVKTMSIKW
jgi:hypothetical protein